MNSFERAWRSVLRKPVKSLLLVLVVTTLSLLFLCGLGAENATVSANDSTRQAVGASFLLEANADNRAKRLAAASAKIGDKEGEADGVHQEKKMVNGQEMWYSWTDHSFETLLESDIDTLAKTEGLSGYTITTAPEAAKPLNFSRIEDADADQSADVGGVALIGNRDMQLDSHVTSGSIALKEGRWITPQDENTVVISQALAEKNGLALGDTLCFGNLDDAATSTQATIVGIYEERQEMTPYMGGDTYRAENVIFCDLHLPEQVSDAGPLYEQAVFQVADVDQYDTVRSALQAADIDWSRYDLIDNNGDLQTMAESFNGLADVSTLLLVVVAGAGLLLLVLILAFWLRARRRELGMLLALGISKRALWGQLVMETFAIGVLALALSFIIAPALSAQAAQVLAGAQLEQAALSATADAATIATDYVAPELTLEGVDTILTPQMFACDAGVVAALIFIATTAAALWHLRRPLRSLLLD